MNYFTPVAYKFAFSAHMPPDSHLCSSKHHYEHATPFTTPAENKHLQAFSGILHHCCGKYFCVEIKPNGRIGLGERAARRPHRTRISHFPWRTCNLVEVLCIKRKSVFDIYDKLSWFNIKFCGLLSEDRYSCTSRWHQQHYNLLLSDRKPGW